MSYLIQQVLNSEELLAIRDILGSTDNWNDGTKTMISSSGKTKKNIELSSKCDEYLEASKILYTAIDRCVDFADYTVPNQSGPILFSRTNLGGFYKPHFDSPDLGEYSSTLFLSDPDKYSGGELSIFIDGRSKKFKLNAGSMVTYPCGMSHMVCEVTKGTRAAAVFWTESKIKNSRRRQMYSDLGRAKRFLPPPPAPHDTVEYSQSDPTFIISQVMNDIIRYGADL
jgi:PKHD-type hydroxylase